MKKSAGTYHFFPPEACDADVSEYSGKAADIWALGVTLYSMIFNQLPFWDDSLNEFAILEYILKNDVVIPEDIRKIDSAQNDEYAVSQELIDLMMRLLDKNSATRIKIEELSENKIF